MALSNEEDLFTEASGELQREVEESLESARESLPAREALVAEKQTALNTIVAGLPAELDPSESAEALRTAQKRFALGEQADAFDEKFSAEMRTALGELEDAVDALQTVGDTAPELAGALTTLHEVHPETEAEAAQTDSPVPEPEESRVAESSPGSEEHSPDDSDETQQSITDESKMADEDTDGNEASKEGDEADSDD